jgi:undecaprenyl pyrophosphate phosphatase UppP
LKLIEIPNYTSLLNAYFAGFVTAAIVGYIAIRWLLHYLSQRPLYIFAIYCLIFGLLNLALILL